MVKRPKNHKVRMFRLYKHTGSLVLRDARSSKSPRILEKVFIGPSVEGGDVEYILVASGKVSHHMPSFVRR